MVVNGAVITGENLHHIFLDNESNVLFEKFLIGYKRITLGFLRWLFITSLEYAKLFVGGLL